jgi:hypothetical protein
MALMKNVFQMLARECIHQKPLDSRSCQSPNKPMQRAGTDKLHGRGRLSVVHEQVTSARVLNRLRAVADGGRSATFTLRLKLSALCLFCVAGHAVARIALPTYPTTLSAKDRVALTKAACAPLGSMELRSVEAWKIEPTSDRILANAVCAPHRSEGTHPVSHYAFCDKNGGRWACEKGGDRLAFTLPNKKIVDLELFDVAVHDVDEFLLELSRHKLTSGDRALSVMSGEWAAWGVVREDGAPGISFAPDRGTRRYTLYRGCAPTFQCTFSFVQHY